MEAVAFVRSVFWNSEEQRIRALWRLLGFAILFLLAFSVLSVPALLIASLLSGPGAPSSGSSIILVIGAASALLAVLISVWLAGQFLDRRPFADFGFRFSRGWWLDLGFGLALGALVMAVVFLVEWAAGWLTITGVFQTASPGQTFAVAILGPLAAFICVGIYEELMARGYLLTNLAEGLAFPALGARFAVVLAWLISSALFGLAHASNPNATAASTLSLVVAGLFLGLGYVLTGELAIPIGMHITWNFFEGNVFGFPVSGAGFPEATFIAVEQGGPPLWTGGAFGPEAGLLVIPMMLLGAVLILLWVRARHGRVALDTALAEPPKRPEA